MKKKNSRNFIIAPRTADEISDLIHDLKSCKSVGPYSIPTKIIKISKEIISLTHSQIIRESISKGSFPNICKLAQVITIFKYDSRLLCRLNFILEQHKHLYPYQFEFCINYSTNNALMTIVERIQKQLDAGKYTGGVFVGLKKAFDTTEHHKIQLKKCDYYGIRSVAKDWFCSYLDN